MLELASPNPAAAIQKYVEVIISPTVSLPLLPWQTEVRILFAPFLSPKLTYCTQNAFTSSTAFNKCDMWSFLI